MTQDQYISKLEAKIEQYKYLYKQAQSTNYELEIKVNNLMNVIIKLGGEIPNEN